MAKRIFVPVDFSKHSLKALALARRVADKGAQITLFHAVEPVFTVAYSFGPEGAVPVYDRALTLKRVKREEAQIKDLAKGIPRARTLVLEAKVAARQIAVQARRSRADLLVMATHGRSGFSKLLFGSVAQKVLALWKGETLLLRPKP